MKRLLLLPFLIGLAFSQSPTPGSRTVLNNPKVQTDIDMAGHKLLNADLSIVMTNSAATIYVSTAGNDSVGVRGTALAFANLSTAIGAASDGDTIICQSGTYPQISASLTTAKNNLKIIGYGATLQTSGPSISGGGWVIKFTGTGNNVSGITFDGNRGSNTSIQGWGLIEITGANNTVNDCKFNHLLGMGVHVTAGGLSGFQSDNVECNDTFSCISGDNTTGTGGVYHFNISRTKMHDGWATSGNPIGVNIQQITGGATVDVTGTVVSPRMWNSPSVTGGFIGVQIQGSHTKNCSVIDAEIDAQWPISFDGSAGAEVRVSRLTGVHNIGVELSAATNAHAIGNTIVCDGTSGSSGFSFADVGGDHVIAEGGSVSNCGRSINATGTNLTVRNITFNQIPAGDDVIYLHNCAGPVLIRNNDFYYDGAARAVDQVLDGATSATHIDFIGNRLYGKPTGEVVKYFKSSTGNTTDSDVAYNVIDVANNLPAGGFVNNTSAGANIRLRYNSPINTTTDFYATDTSGTIKNVGKVDFSRATDDWINDDLLLFNRVGDALNQVANFSAATGSTATPGYINLGMNFSNTAGIHEKIILYDGGDSGGVSSYGIGVSTSSFDLNADTGAGYNFYIHGVKKLTINSSGNLIATLPTSCSGLATGTLYNNSGTPAFCP